ncbi:DUF1054 domain-containing protein [Shimazuella sp. AN120528]|uniref:YktB family protein n=1 Tax=Shimazuella soli TaxID=1892854 RepID=UPI001F0DA40B|nr:DUF1054 domain-containing protein [Shimazuella soli]MCH5584008.1 DUF1054 domain-containing protein [Shimazuella soli]
MVFPTFTEQDFHVFAIDGLETRMEALQREIQPKFSTIGEHVSAHLTNKLGDTVYTHIARHARRTVNPPEETWVAWATNKRGYKAHPHFQLGLRDTFVFAWFALIYECEQKQQFANNFLKNVQKYSNQIPKDFYISLDHTIPDVTLVKTLDKENWESIMKRLATVKKAEFLCGMLIPRKEAVSLNGNVLQKKIEKTFDQLLPLYHLSFE